MFYNCLGKSPCIFYQVFQIKTFNKIFSNRKHLLRFTNFYLLRVPYTFLMLTIVIAIWMLFSALRNKSLNLDPNPFLKLVNWKALLGPLLPAILLSIKFCTCLYLIWFHIMWPKYSSFRRFIANIRSDWQFILLTISLLVTCSVHGIFKIRRSRLDTI